MFIILAFLFSAFSSALHGVDFVEQLELKHQYERASNEPSDINEHLFALRFLAMQCSSVMEIGVRTMVSSWGVLQGLSESPSASRSYLGIDIDSPPPATLNLAKRLAAGNGISFDFWQANDMHVDIGPTDMLFIDTLHTYCHLTYELEKFSPKVNQYIAIHDTSPTWGDIDCTSYLGDYSEYPPEYDRTKRGLWPAVVDFLQRHPEWTLYDRRLNNNGLTVLKRIEKPAVSPKIYDCFLFYNELEILEIKLNELYDHVDYFVLVESTKTFRGSPKPLYFAENQQRFDKFLDKIIHVVVNDSLETNDPWKREAYQRNQILRGLTSCNDEDIVIIEDLDEIIRAEKLPEIVAPLLANRSRYVTCSQTLYTFFLNRYGHPGNVIDWLGSVAARYADVESRSPEGIRSERNAAHAIRDAGWHFTSMGGIDRVIKKIENFSHYELDNAVYKHPNRIHEDVEALKLVQIDETYPQFVRNNIPYFKELGLIDQKTPLPEPYTSIEPLPFDPHGWYRHEAVMEEFFKKYSPEVVVEVGCWLGRSTRHMASLLQKGDVLYAVDHWLGSSEMQPGHASWSPKLPYLYEQFLSNVIHAGLTDKIIPVRMNSLDANKFLANVRPDLVYIDASHDYDAVYADLAAWYPLVKGRGILCGDDYLDGDGYPIRRAVDQFAGDNYLLVRNVGSFWYYVERWRDF